MASRSEVYEAFERECKAQQIAIDLIADRSAVVWPSKDGVSRLRLPDRTPVLCTTVTLTEPGMVVVESGILQVYRAMLSRGTHMIPCSFLYSGAEGVVHADGRVESTVLAAEFERMRTKPRDTEHPVVVTEPFVSRTSDFKYRPRTGVALLSLEIHTSGTRVEVFTKHAVVMGMFSGEVAGEARLADLPIENGRVTVHFDHAPKPNTMDWVRVRVHDGDYDGVGPVRMTARYLNTMQMVEGSAGLKYG